MSLRQFSYIVVVAAGLAVLSSHAQATGATIDGVPAGMLRGQERAEAHYVPYSCSTPMAKVEMMSAIQSIVGPNIHQQLVDITDIHTIYVNHKNNSYKCKLTTLWSSGAAVSGLFTWYHNAIGEVVTVWQGLARVPNPVLGH